MFMREENRRVWEALAAEKKKVQRLTGIVKTLWDVVGKGFPGSVSTFPQDLLDSEQSPNIYITSPTSAGPPRSFPPPLTTNLNSQSLHSMQSLSSPNSSPTTADFPNQMQMHPPSAPPLSRQHSYQQMAYANSRAEPATSTPLPPSPGSGSMDLFESGEAGDGRIKTKRQRTTNENLPGGTTAEEGSSPGTGGSSGVSGKRLSRARSDSAPLGYGLGAGLNTNWQGATRPRSGSGMTGRVGMPGVGNTNHTNGGGSGHGTPLLSISTVASNSPSR